MKRFLTIFCAIAFSGAALSAQNDTIKVSRNESDTLVIIVKEKQSIDRQAKKEQRLAEKALKPAYMINVGYKRGYRADITHNGIRTFANPAVGLDIARFSLKVGYEYQLGFWGHLDGVHLHNVKLGVAYIF